MDSIISKKYSKALFDTSLENNNLDILLEEAKFIYNILNENKELNNILEDSNVSKNKKMSLIKSFNNFSNDMLGLFNIIFIKNREKFISNILKDFIKLGNDHKKIKDIIISTPKQLTENEVNNIKEILSKKLNIIVNEKVVIDKSLLGGLKIYFDDFIFDSSIKNKISNIKNNLKY